MNIALVRNNRSILGVIYSPVFKDLYFASEGTGSFKITRHDLIPVLDDLHTFTLERLILLGKKLPAHSYPEVYTLVASRSHLSKEIYTYIEEKKVKHGQVNIVNTGSSIKMCWVAEGIADEYPRYGPTMEWDTAAGQAILENAGCELIDLNTDQPMKYNRPDLRNNSFIARRKGSEQWQ